jgi:hypothetical protein
MRLEDAKNRPLRFVIASFHELASENVRLLGLLVVLEQEWALWNPVTAGEAPEAPVRAPTGAPPSRWFGWAELWQWVAEAWS